MPKRLLDRFNPATATIMTRQEAVNAKRTRYYTGEPCKHGHLAERYVSTNGCTDCLKPPSSTPTRRGDDAITWRPALRVDFGTLKPGPDAFKVLQQMTQEWLDATLRKMAADDRRESLRFERQVTQGKLDEPESYGPNDPNPDYVNEPRRSQLLARLLEIEGELAKV